MRSSESTVLSREVSLLVLMFYVIQTYTERIGQIGLHTIEHIYEFFFFSLSWGENVGKKFSTIWKENQKRSKALK